MIETNEITSILLADGWHDIELGSFCTEDYALMHEDTTGFWCAPIDDIDHDADFLAGPLSSLLAIRGRFTPGSTNE